MQTEKLAYSFQIDGNPISCSELGNGHINTTFKIMTDKSAEYVLQRINKYVFKKPEQVMANASSITNHLRTKVTDPRDALHFIPAKNGLYYHVDEYGEFWRMYDFVGGFCLDYPDSDEDFYQSALAFGRFQHMLNDFPADSLYETIPNFHNTAHRFEALRNSVLDDPCGRLAEVRSDVDTLLQQEEISTQLCRMLDAGELPLRVTHNDTKLNNVLLDRKTRKSLCVLDLDTVMPGLSAYDFGDSIRFGAATAVEDEPDTSKMGLDLHLFEIYTRGFLEAAPTLTDKEVDVLPLGALTMTLELVARFLKDYIDGDLYFKIAYPTHNLVRARAQMALGLDMIAKWDEMNRIVAEVAKQVRG